MKLVRIISVIALCLSRILSVGYMLTALHLLLSVIFTLASFKLLPGNRFVIYYPFSSKPFLLGSAYTTSYVAEMFLLILFYSIFFWLLSNVFKTFKQNRLFTARGILYLKQFYITNLAICPALFLILSLYSTEDYPYGVMGTAHGIMGIFALFIAAIFQQGVNLQNDQDLII